MHQPGALWCYYCFSSTGGCYICSKASRNQLTVTCRPVQESQILFGPLALYNTKESDIWDYITIFYLQWIWRRLRWLHNGWASVSFFFSPSMRKGGLDILIWSKVNGLEALLITHSKFAWNWFWTVMMFDCLFSMMGGDLTSVAADIDRVSVLWRYQCFPVRCNSPKLVTIFH